MAPRHNLIVIIADQLRRDALGVYGDETAVTPQIDSLARRGAQFTRASSTYPVCVPFRFSLMTGEYAHSRFIPAIEWRMSPAERTIAHEFNDAGYHTAYFGKWHLYGGYGILPGFGTRKANRTPVPRQHRGGWQRFCAFELSTHLFDTVYFEDDDPTPKPVVGYQTDGVFALAEEYLSSRGEGDDPFLCVISVEPPHPPLIAPERYMEEWSTRDIAFRGNVDHDMSYKPRGPQSETLLDDTRAYYAAIENLDDNVGRLMARLAELGLDDTTNVVLLSDHGEMLGSHGMYDKQQPYEESVGIPLIVTGPSVPEGHVVELPTNTEDLYPTLLGLANLESSTEKPGQDLSPLIRGEASHDERDGVLLEFVAEFRPGRPYFEETWRAVRTADWKYVVLGGQDGGVPWLLFDLANDPLEQRNLVDDPTHVEDARRLHELLRGKLESTGDHYVLAPAWGLPGWNLWA